MTDRVKAAIEARERRTRGEPEPKKPKKAPAPKEADGAEG